jgi:hypothetical protein
MESVWLQSPEKIAAFKVLQIQALANAHQGHSPVRRNIRGVAFNRAVPKGIVSHQIKPHRMEADELRFRTCS